MKCFVFNGWVAGAEMWSRCTFARDRIFDYVELLDGVAERALAAVDGAVVVGFSMGGTMALQTLLRQPEKIRGLVLVSATPCLTERKDEGWAGMGSRRTEAFRLGVSLMHPYDGTPGTEDANVDRGLEYLRKTDLRRQLVDFSVSRQTAFPVRVLQSQRDGIVRPHNAAFLQGVFPQAKVTMLAVAGHDLPMLAPEAVDAAVAEVLAEIMS